jgi:hypothetical protein
MSAGPKGQKIKGLGIPFSEYQSRSFVNITFAAFGGRIMQASKQTSKQARYSASYTLIVYIIQGVRFNLYINFRDVCLSLVYYNNRIITGGLRVWCLKPDGSVSGAC